MLRGSIARTLIASLFIPNPHVQRSSLGAQIVKNLPAMWKTQVWSLGRVDPLEKGRRTKGRQRMRWFDGITDSMDKSLSKDSEGQGSLQSMGSQSWTQPSGWTTTTIIPPGSYSGALEAAEKTLWSRLVTRHPDHWHQLPEGHLGNDCETCRWDGSLQTPPQLLWVVGCQVCFLGME